MSTVQAPPRLRTLADLQRRLGGVPLDRIRMQPYPGSATVQDLLAVAAKEDRRCELVEGVLVEKPMGLEESLLAGWLIVLLSPFVHSRNLGIVTGEQGTMRILPHLVRIPDVAFISWDRMPGRTRPAGAVPALVPDLAVEVLSENNTPGEMAVKRGEYFTAGVTVVWEIDPRKRTVTVYTAPAQALTLTASDTLDAAPVLPGFTLPLVELFGELDRHG
jgi:Uma2 family endonuclease